MKNYYVLASGRVKRQANTLYLETADGTKKPLPIEDVDSLYLYGEVDINTRLLNFLSQRRVALHVFNWHGFYSGSYYPREYLHSGFLLVQQAAHYAHPEQRLTIARELVRGAAHGLRRNLAYYARRREAKRPEEQDEQDRTNAPDAADETPDTGVPTDPTLEAAVDALLSTADDADISDPDDGGWDTPETDAETSGGGESITNDAPAPAPAPAPTASLTWLEATVAGLSERIGDAADPDALRGIEGKIRERYFAAWPHILADGWEFTRRVRRPPDNEVNALISFGNSYLYTICLSEIYRTQLTPEVSFLHEPGARRFSLALDLSEIFKPLIVDRAIFRLVNTGQLSAKDFDRGMNGCFLSEQGKRTFLSALEERLGTTIKHRRLGRHVSYRHLIRLECYKLIRHLSGAEPYRAFRAWW